MYWAPIRSEINNVHQLIGQLKVKKKMKIVFFQNTISHRNWLGEFNRNIDTGRNMIIIIQSINIGGTWSQYLHTYTYTHI